MHIENSKDKLSNAVLDTVTEYIIDSNSVNRAELNAAASNISSNDASDVSNTTSSNVSNTVANKLLRFQYDLLAAKDAMEGIYSQVIESENTNGQAHLIFLRDARTKHLHGDADSKYSFYNYSMLVIDYALALQSLIEINNWNSTKVASYIDNKTTTCLNTLAAAKSPSTYERLLAKFVNDLNHYLCEESFTNNVAINSQQAKKQLDNAKNWVTLKSESKSLVTLTNGVNDDVLVQMDIPMVELTDEQKREYATDEYKNRLWYQNLDPTSQKLVAYYKSDIISGRVLPSQLRGSLLGGKNSYQQIVNVVKSDGDKTTTTELLNSYHCGTVVHLDKQRDTTEQQTETHNEMQRLARMNISQQRVWSKTDSSLMITLNSMQGDAIVERFEYLKYLKDKIVSFFTGKKPRFNEFRYQGDDEPIVKITKAASKVAETHSANVCLNGFRKLFPNDYNGVQALTANTAKLLGLFANKNINPDRVLSKKAKKRLNKILTSHGRFMPQQMREHLRAAMENYNELINRMCSVSLIDAEVNGLDIVACTSMLAYHSNALVEWLRTDGHIIMSIPSDQLESLKTIAAWYGCASGENRTGFAEFHNIFRAYEAYLKRNNFSQQQLLELRPYLITNLAESGHVPTMVGFEGSTFGTMYMRKKSAGSIPAYYPQAARNKLIGPYGDIKSVALLEERAAAKEKLVSSYSILHKVNKQMMDALASFATMPANLQADIYLTMKRIDGDIQKLLNEMLQLEIGSLNQADLAQIKGKFNDIGAASLADVAQSTYDAMREENILEINAQQFFNKMFNDLKLKNHSIANFYKDKQQNLALDRLASLHATRLQSKAIDSRMHRYKMQDQAIDAMIKNINNVKELHALRDALELDTQAKRELRFPYGRFASLILGEDHNTYMWKAINKVIDKQLYNLEPDVTIEAGPQAAPAA